MSAGTVPSPNGRTSGPVLLICTGISVALYGIFFAAAFPFAQYYAIPLRDLGKLTGHSPEGALQFFGAFAILFALYMLVYRIASGSLAASSSRWRFVVLAAPLLLVLPLIATYPVGAADVYDYSFFVRMLGHYGANPMLHPPADFPGDAWLRYVAWPQAASPYGPLWQALSALVFRLAGDDLAATIISFKLLASGSLLACAALAYFILRDWRPRDALSGFVLVAWNPLLLFESAANAHNDAVMMVFVLLALRLQQRSRFTLAMIALVLAAFVKFPAVLAIPIFGLATLRALPDWRVRAGWMLTTAASVLLAAGLIYLPVAAGPNPFGNLASHQNMFTTSFAALAVFFARAALGLSQAQYLALLTALFVLGALLLWIVLPAPRDFRSLAHATYLALLALLLVGTIWFQPWYLVWMVALAALAARGARLTAVVFSASVLAAYLVFDFALFWMPELFARDDGLTLNLFSVSLVFGPPLIVILARSLTARVRANGTKADWLPGQPDPVANA